MKNWVSGTTKWVKQYCQNMITNETAKAITLRARKNIKSKITAWFDMILAGRICSVGLFEVIYSSAHKAFRSTQRTSTIGILFTNVNLSVPSNLVRVELGTLREKLVIGIAGLVKQISIPAVKKYSSFSNSFFHKMLSLGLSLQLRQQSQKLLSRASLFRIHQQAFLKSSFSTNFLPKPLDRNAISNYIRRFATSENKNALTKKQIPSNKSPVSSSILELLYEPPFKKLIYQFDLLSKFLVCTNIVYFPLIYLKPDFYVMASMVIAFATIVPLCVSRLWTNNMISSIHFTDKFTKNKAVSEDLSSFFYLQKNSIFKHNYKNSKNIDELLLKIENEPVFLISTYSIFWSPKTEIVCLSQIEPDSPLDATEKQKNEVKWIIKPKLIEGQKLSKIKTVLIFREVVIKSPILKAIEKRINYRNVVNKPESGKNLIDFKI
ncbi:hypothetical protein BB561_003911 [Smittium simulii]|uniref:Uncharacterized protein n=1 Tax=Smittium simulii TaxID=133385 RepID=A0A2T9YIZ0_9FUNG|nr:hypothetical protein BB561_003911 [Smittium simulii]